MELVAAALVAADADAVPAADFGLHRRDRVGQFHVAHGTPDAAAIQSGIGTTPCGLHGIERGSTDVTPDLHGMESAGRTAAPTAGSGPPPAFCGELGPVCGPDPPQKHPTARTEPLPSVLAVRSAP